MVQLSNKFKNPYVKQIKREPKTGENSSNIKIDIENHLLKKPREGRAFLPGGTSNIRTINELLFIPLEKMTVKEQNLPKQNEELFEIATTTNLFSIDTIPLHIEDIGEPLQRKSKNLQEPLRYYGLKIKKMKPNLNRKTKKEENN